MSALDYAWFAVAVLLGAMVIVVCVVLANVFRVLTSTKDLIDGVTSQTVPLLQNVNGTVTLVNQELIRVDGILSTAETVTSTVGNLVNVVASTISSPLVRLSALAYGLRKAAGRAAEGEEEPPRRRRWRR
jgi:predicted PurR-regulated permease PerM